MRNWLLITLLASSQAAFALSEEELETVLEEARVEMKMPGLRAAVRLRDGEIVRGAVGLADKEAKIPLDDSIGMPGGSTGKTFVAALTMLLVEDGTLSLDDPASKWLGDTEWYHRLPNADDIRVRHLLSHSSGIPDYPGTLSFRMKMTWRVLRHGSAMFEPEELIELVLDKQPEFPAGEGFRYTDAGYLVLGRLIEAATGRSYYDLLTESILLPLHLDEIRPAMQSALPGITPGYQMGARNLRKDGRMKFDPRSEWTGGGLVTNPTMLVQFLAALAGGRIVSPDGFDRMVESGWKNPDQPGFHYGFGLFVSQDGSSFGHGGVWPGYRSQVVHYASSGVTVAVQTNRDGRLDLRGLADRLAAMTD